MGVHSAKHHSGAPDEPGGRPQSRLEKIAAQGIEEMKSQLTEHDLWIDEEGSAGSMALVMLHGLRREDEKRDAVMVGDNAEDISDVVGMLAHGLEAASKAAGIPITLTVGRKHFSWGVPDEKPIPTEPASRRPWWRRSK